MTRTAHVPDHPTAGPPPRTLDWRLPADLDLTPLSRRPLKLSERTVQTVMSAPVPAAPGAEAATTPRASIVIVTFNNLVFTRMCLAGLFGNTESPGRGYEVIVVDNGSADGTTGYLRAVAATNPHVRVLLNPDNRGFAPANNQGLAAAAGDVLVLLNNDTIVPPGWLDRLARHLDEDPAVGLVGPVTNRIGNEAEVETDYRTYGQFLKSAARRAEAEAGRLFDIPTPCMFCLALRRQAWQQIGPLDERYEVGLLEDDDYALRAREAGYRPACAQDVLVHHFGQASFGGLVPTGEYTRVLEANKRRFEQKWGRPWEPYGRRPGTKYLDMTEGVRRLAREALPDGAAVLVVSRGDDELLAGVGPGARHFPQDETGRYAGCYPADSAAAVAHLEKLRRAGAAFLLLPWTALWWLEHYPGLRQYLERTCQPPLAGESTCLLFDLRSPDPAATPHGGSQEGRP